MSDTPRSTTNTVIIVLVVAVVVLAAGLGYAIWNNGRAVPAVTELPTTPGAGTGATGAGAAGTGAGATGSGSGAMGGSPGAATGAQGTVPADFDAKTATKVAAGMTPEKWVAAYYAAADKGDWVTAFNHLPAAKQQGSSPDALKQQVEGYGVVGFKIASAAEQGDKATVVVDQQTSQYGTFENTWVFKKDGNTWLVASKAVTGMK